MGYSLLPWSGDSISVPSAVFKKLGTTAKEAFFRVILHILSTKDTDPASISAALHLPVSEVDKALVFWQGADLLSEDAAPSRPLKEPPHRLTTREVYKQSQADPNISVLLNETQNIFGEVISETSCSILVSLYVNHHMSLEFLLTALNHLKLEGWTMREIRRAEKQLLRWQEEGIHTAEDFDNYLKRQKQREGYEQEVAGVLHIPAEQFTRSDCIKIASWYEDMHFSEPMISQAALAAGSKCSVTYINGILKRWFTKGYRQVRDVLAAESGQNANTVKNIKAEDDILAQHKISVPKFSKE